MNDSWDELIQKYIDGVGLDSETLKLQAELRKNPSLCERYLDYINLDVALGAIADARVIFEDFGKGQESSPLMVVRSSIHRPMIAASVGLILGLLGASVVWAITGSKFAVTAVRLSELTDGSFESSIGIIRSGFPATTQIWSGDDAEIVRLTRPNARSGQQSLRFRKAERDNQVVARAHFATPEPAACDVFQLVDLRRAQTQVADGVDAELELSASFLDARHEPGVPIRFICHIRLFEGNPSAMHEIWPSANHESVGLGAAKFDSFGGGDQANGWTRLVARCVFPRNADYAVVWIAAARTRFGDSIQNELGQQYVDDVQLELKTQPFLPTRSKKQD